MYTYMYTYSIQYTDRRKLKSLSYIKDLQANLNTGT